MVSRLAWGRSAPAGISALRPPGHAFDGHRRLAAEMSAAGFPPAGLAVDLAGDPGMDGATSRARPPTVAENDGTVAQRPIWRRPSRESWGERCDDSLPARRGIAGFRRLSLEASLAATAGGGVMAYLAKPRGHRGSWDRRPWAQPMTEERRPASEMTNVTTRAGAAVAASLPPLMRDACARTHLRDRRPGFKQRPVDRACRQVRAGGGECQQCRGAARDQAEHEITGREPAHRRQDAPPPPHHRVWHGMGGLD
jgi:hypothetical protein